MEKDLNPEFGAVDSVPLVQKFQKFLGGDLLPLKIQDDPLEGDVLFTVGTVHDVGGKQDQLSRGERVQIVLEHVVPFSLLQIINLIVVVIVGLEHIVVYPAYAFTGDAAPLRHLNPCLVDQIGSLPVKIKNYPKNVRKKKKNLYK